MRIGIVSDIHCNVRGLQMALEALGDADEILCAGDMVYQYRFSNEVFDILKERQVRCILGNHEATILSRDGVLIRDSGTIRPEHLKRLMETPTILETRVDGKKLYMVHGSPWNPLREYLFVANPNFRRLAEIEADFLITGHTHFPVVQRVGGVLAINPGSCGEARDPRYRFQLTYAILDSRSEEVTIGALPDPDQTRSLESAPSAGEEGLLEHQEGRDLWEPQER